MTGKKRIMQNIPYLIFAYLFAKFAEGCRLAEGAGFSDKVLNLADGLAAAFGSVAATLQPQDILTGVICAALLRLAVYQKEQNAKKFRKGEEYGSARFGTPADIASFIDPDPDRNIILTQTERLTMDSRPKDPALARNKNVLVIGGSGSGKTRFFVKPQLMQLHSSYLVTDPKGTVLAECGRLLLAAGFKVRVFNTVDFSASMKYNPFEYIHSEQDILKLVSVIIENTKGKGDRSGEDFWVKAERLYYMALIGYIHYEAPDEERNIVTLLEMIGASETREDDENFKNQVDLLFDELEKRSPDHFAVSQYKKYKLAAGKTAKSILISCGVRLAPFDIEELRGLMEHDELGLDMLGDEKSALFIITSDTDSTFDFLSSMVLMQTANSLCTKADTKYGGRLPVHVRMLLDEFANVKIPDMERLISTVRSREISAALCVQSLSQLKAIYKENLETITDNCDSLLFLGGKGSGTLKEISEMLGKETIDLMTATDTRGQSPSYSTNFQKAGRELMSKDEIAAMDGGKCICQLRGVRPFLSVKYDITKHPRYKYLADEGEKNALGIKAYVRHARRGPGHSICGKEDIVEYYLVT